MYYQKEGDIIFYKEEHWRDKISRLVMSSKTIWHYLRGIKEKVLYYHVSIAYGNKVIIEQKRWGPRMINWNPHKKQIIFRPINKKEDFVLEHRRYDFLNCFGHLLAWFSGFQSFRKLHSKNKQNCILMGMCYLENNCNETFPVNNLWEWHTHDLYKYLLNDVYYTVVYKNE